MLYSILTHVCLSAAAFLFALALLCSGQSASITATLAGQIVSEGFIEWRISVCIILSEGSIELIFGVSIAASSTNDYPLNWIGSLDGSCDCSR